jgi:glutaredoxin-like protein NrdH
MTVTVYAKPGCPPCDATCRALAKHGLDIDKRDITTDSAARDEAVALGYTSTPVVVAGDEHWSGFRPDRIKALVA